MCRARCLWLPLALLAVCGCEAIHTEVVVVIDAQPVGRGQAAELHVVVLGHDGSVRLDDVRPIDATTPWPLRLPLVPDGGDASRTWTVEASLRDADGNDLATARSHGRYVEGGLRESLLCIYDGCVSCGTSADCASGRCETCRTGLCVDAEATLDAVGFAPHCPPLSCIPTAAFETCDNDLDDDCDGRIDCIDDECDCTPPACIPSPEEDATTCFDNLDNDCDGLADCDDPGCARPEGPENCNNGVDDDCDGRTDCYDSACCLSPSCAGQACGSGGFRCCGSLCTDTWDDDENCGSCGIVCVNADSCDRPRTPSGAMVQGAACRCPAPDRACTGSRTCVAHGVSNFCNCRNDGDCRAGRCIVQSGDYHNVCTR